MLHLKLKNSIENIKVTRKTTPTVVKVAGKIAVEYDILQEMNF